MLHVRGVLDGLVRARHRLSRMALQPQSSRQNCAGQMSALKAEIDRRGPLSAQPTPDGAFEFGSGAAVVTKKVERNPQNGMGQLGGRRVLHGSGERRAAPRIMEGGFEIAGAQVE